MNLVDTLESYGFDGLARQHSRKPEEAYDLVDALLPSHARKADIFSRQVRPGWIRGEIRWTSSRPCHSCIVAHGVHAS